MEKKEISIYDMITIKGFTFIPIIEVSLKYWYDKGKIYYFGLKQPFAIVIVTNLEKRAIGIDGIEIPISRLIQDIPDLQEKLATLEMI